MKNILIVGLILISVAIFGFRISKSVALNQNVTGYLKRASTANSIPLANEELTKTINYLEANNLTSGYTSIFWETPDEDIGFWYKNLKVSQEELQNLKPQSALEKTNVLMKLRESLMSGGEKSKVIVPEGLEVYPDNILWAILMTLAIFAGFGAFIILVVEVDKKSKQKTAILLSKLV